MLRTVHLHGALKDRFQQEKLELDVDTPFMLFAGLRSQLPGFRKYEASDANLAIVLTDETKQHGQSVTVDAFQFPFGKATDIHLVPKVEGQDPITAIAAISTALSVGTFTATVIYIAAAVAVSFAVGKVMQAFAPSPTDTASERPDERPSFLYNGAVNITEQGYPVPLVYGIHTTGSIVVSAGVTVEQIPYEPDQEDPPANGGGTPQPASPPRVSWQWG